MDHLVEVDVLPRKHSKLSVVRSLALPNCDRAGIVLAKSMWDDIVLPERHKVSLRTTLFFTLLQFMSEIWT